MKYYSVGSCPAHCTYSHILKGRYGVQEVAVGDDIKILQLLTMDSYLTDCLNSEPLAGFLDLIYEEAGALPLMCLISDAVNTWLDVEELDFKVFFKPWLKENLEEYLDACIFGEVCNYNQENQKHNAKMEKVKEAGLY